MSDGPTPPLGSWPPPPEGGTGAVPFGGSAPPPPPPPVDGGPSEEEAGWAAPSRPSSDQPPPDGGFAPPPAPVPAAGSGSDSAPGRSGRRKAPWLALVAALVVFGGRALVSNQGDDSSSPSDFAPPPRDEGPPVTATPLDSDEVCDLVTKEEMRSIYDRRFEEPQAMPELSTPATGEPSEPSDEVLSGSCLWTALGDPFLRITVLSVPPLGGDANATYERLRPDSLALAVDSDEDVGDESFIASPPFGQDDYSGSMTVRSGGVLLRIEVEGAEEPEAGVQGLIDIALAAVDDLPEDG